MRSVEYFWCLAFVVCLCTSAGLKRALGASIWFLAKCVFSPEPLSEPQIFVQYFKSLFLVLKGVLSRSLSSQRRYLWNCVWGFVLLSHTPPEQVQQQNSTQEDADENMFLNMRHTWQLLITQFIKKSKLNLCDVLCSIKHKQSFTNKVLLSIMKVKRDPTPGLLLKAQYVVFLR